VVSQIVVTFKDEQLVPSNSKMLLKFDQSAHIFVVVSNVVKQGDYSFTMNCCLDCLVACVHSVCTKPVY